MHTSVSACWFQTNKNKGAYLCGAAEVNGDGAREDDVADGGAAEVVDAEVHAGHAPVPRRHVRPHAGHPLRHQRRHAAVEHLERLTKFCMHTSIDQAVNYSSSS